MKFLIVGLGNIGDEYSDTRHNIGFNVLNAFANESGVAFSDKRYGSVCEIKYKGRIFLLLKPSTYMNLSGHAVSYWLKKGKIAVENLLVIVDDIALPLGSIRMKPKGSAGGHNGLSHINTILATSDYARIRIGIGNGYKRGNQVNYVLSKWSPQEKKFLDERISVVIEMIKSFGIIGTDLTMTAFNRSLKAQPPQEEGNEKNN
jgi:PTH1 family peptidyl-tRNA hydrolase